MADPYLINGSGGAMDLLGVIAAEQVWEVDDENTCVSFTPDHPLGIPILERQWREQAHGKWHVTLKFEGVTDVSKADGKETYEGDSGSTEDPIETHPAMNGPQGLLVTYQGNVLDGRIVWPTTITDSATQITAPNPMFGKESWKTSNPNWTQHKLYAELPDDLYSGLNCIFETVPGPAKIPPDDAWSHLAPRPRKWFLDRVIPRQRGNIWQVSRTWLMTGPGGPVEGIYPNG